MTTEDTQAIARIICILTDHGHWQTIVADELIDKLADYLETQSATCNQVHPGQDVYHPNGHTFDKEVWIAACFN